MLVENSLFGTTNKVADAINLLQQNELPKGYYLCFSGGKDSVIILDLIKRTGVKFEAHHHILTIEQPELIRFIFNQYPEIINAPLNLCISLFYNSVARLIGISVTAVETLKLFTAKAGFKLTA